MQCYAPMLVKNPRISPKQPYQYHRVPCGKCEACVQNKISNWFVRLKMQMRYSDYSCFVTLTYNDENLPPGENVCKDDVIKYHHRLRKRLSAEASKRFKYYLVSEYGGTFHRPHYHAIYFGLKPSDWHYILDSWQHGFVKVDPVNDARLRYVCGYVIEKNFVPEGREPVWTLMSKGLGAGYVDEYKGYHDHIDRMYVVLGDGKKMPMPRYYKERLYNAGQRSLYADRCAQQAEDAYQQSVAEVGIEATEQHLYDVRSNYARKMYQRRMRQKKQF